jgi:membrane peptidoglycan carboxypeptidase
MRRLFSVLAKVLYKEKYISLQTKLLLEYTKLEKKHESTFDLMSQLLISGEDHRFLYHFGFDIYAILRAIKNRILLNRFEGASTIEQQIVRVLTNDYKINLGRKIQEIFLSTTLASNVPRKCLPALYLNIAYYGTGLHGLKPVLAKYDIQNVESITLEIAAEIVSRIKYPEPNQKSIKRTSQIEMRKQHLINLYKNHKIRKFSKIYE